MTGDFDSTVASLTSVTLAELDRLAPFRARRDRKYLVTESVAVDLLAAVAEGVGVLEIDDRRSFRYETTYFDTPDLELFEAAARGRRRRFKVRVRAYPDAGTSFCEVKTTDGGGRTQKHRSPRLADGIDRLSTGDEAFIDAVLGERSVVGALEPVLTTRYRRTSIVARDGRLRLTVDRQLRCDDVAGLSVGLGELAVVEVKSDRPRTDVDRWLWRHGARPTRFSKYATALATTRPGLAHHRWHRQMREFDIVDA